MSTKADARRRIEVQLMEPKRKRIRVAVESSSEDEHVDEQEEINVIEENIAANEVVQQNDSDAENEELVEFKLGMTQKGGRALWYNGYRFTRANNNAYRCDRWRTFSCKARAVIVDVEDGIYTGKLKEEHNHMPNEPGKKAEERKVMVTQRAKENPRMRPIQILTVARRSLNDEEYLELGGDEALRKRIQRQKKKIMGNIDTRDLGAINFPPALINRNGRSILIYDSRTKRDDNVVFIFADIELLDLLKREKHWHIDSTFKAAPQMWMQSFVIGASIKRKMVIAVHALLPSKQERFYREVLEVVKAKITPFTPSRVLADFEIAEHNAVRDIFGEADLNGCLFHFGQTLFRKWRKLGLLPLGQQHAVRISFRNILSLALLPNEHIRRAFYLTVASAPNGLQRFFAYFAANYIGRTRHEYDEGAQAFGPSIEREHPAANRPNQSVQFGLQSPQPSTPTLNTTWTSDHNYSRLIDYSISNSSDNFDPEPQEQFRWLIPINRAPRFPMDLWCINRRAMEELDRTNNALESSHSHFARELRTRPTLSDYIHRIMEDIPHQLDIAKGARLGTSRKRHKVHVIQDEQIKALLAEANYDTNESISGLLYEIGLQIRGYVKELFVRPEIASDDDEAGGEHLDDDDAGEEEHLDDDNISV